MELAKLIRDSRGKKSRDALGRETGLTSKAIENYEIRGRQPELLPLIRLALAADEPFQSLLLGHLPEEVWKAGAAMIDSVCKRRGLDRPDTIIDALRAGPKVSSPKVLIDKETTAVQRQTSGAQEIYADEYQSPQHQKRKHRRSKAS